MLRFGDRLTQNATQRSRRCGPVVALALAVVFLVPAGARAGSLALVTCDGSTASEGWSAFAINAPSESSVPTCTQSMTLYSITYPPGLGAFLSSPSRPSDRTGLEITGLPVTIRSSAGISPSARWDKMPAAKQPTGTRSRNWRPTAWKTCSGKPHTRACTRSRSLPVPAAGPPPWSAKKRRRAPAIRSGCTYSPPTSCSRPTPHHRYPRCRDRSRAAGPSTARKT